MDFVLSTYTKISNQASIARQIGLWVGQSFHHFDEYPQVFVFDILQPRVDSSIFDEFPKLDFFDAGSNDIFQSILLVFVALQLRIHQQLSLK